MPQGMCHMVGTPTRTVSKWATGMLVCFLENDSLFIYVTVVDSDLTKEQFCIY